MQQQQNRRPFNGNKNQKGQHAPIKEERTPTLTDTLRSVDKGLFYLSLPMILAWVLIFFVQAFSMVPVTPGAVGKTALIFIAHSLIIYIARTEKELRANSQESLPQNYIAMLLFGLFMGGLFNVFIGFFVAVLLLIATVMFKLNTNHITITLIAAWAINTFHVFLTTYGFMDTFTYLFSSNVWEENAMKLLVTMILMMFVSIIMTSKENKQIVTSRKEEVDEGSLYEDEEEDEEIQPNISSNKNEDEVEEENDTPVAKQFFQNPQPEDEDKIKNLKKNIRFW